MATKDYSALPIVVTITNNAKEVPAVDAGSAQRKKEFIDTDRTIQFYRVNSFVTLKKGDVVKIAAKTSEEAAYFESLATDDVTVEIAGASNE